jgi:amino acid adenylation domain-containing protein
MTNAAVPLKKTVLFPLDARPQSRRDGNAVETQTPVQECRRRSCTPQLIAAAAAAAPDSIALLSPHTGTQMTYGELDSASNNLASHLISRGVGRETPVAVCLDRSFHYVIAALAAWKAGGAYLPIDSSWPESRREAIIADSGAHVLIFRCAGASSAPHVIDVDRHPELFLPGDASPIGISLRREDLAYINYTSGTTGVPKGVEITHGNLLNLVSWHRRAFEITPSDRTSHVAGLAFDAAVWELWPHLAAGATVVLVDPEIRTSPDLLRQWLIAQRISVAFVPTTLADPMLTAPWPQQTDLRLLLTGSDTLHRFPADDLPFAVVNNYGPTECTVVATSGAIRGTAGQSTRPDIGVPVQQTQIHILDENRSPVAEGEIGEIYIGGCNVGRGYRNQPQVTAERFVPDTFSSRPDALMYRTGDMGRFSAGGRIEFHGRVDGQEKIRGHRVEPDEVAGMLMRHPEVRNCVVIGFGDATERQLAAYIVPQAGTRPEPGLLREFLSTQLPDYMIPAVFMRIDEVPLNANGKLDRSALPLPSRQLAGECAPFRAPASPIEKALAAILCELLKLDRVGTEDNFFLLGGHSLLGAQLVIRARQRFGIDLTLRNLFEAPTAGQLADVVERLFVQKIESMSEDEAALLLSQMEEK